MHVDSHEHSIRTQEAIAFSSKDISADAIKSQEFFKLYQAGFAKIADGSSLFGSSLFSLFIIVFVVHHGPVVGARHVHLINLRHKVAGVPTTMEVSPRKSEYRINCQVSFMPCLAQASSRSLMGTLVWILISLVKMANVRVAVGSSANVSLSIEDLVLFLPHATLRAYV